MIIFVRIRRIINISLFSDGSKIFLDRVVVVEISQKPDITLIVMIALMSTSEDYFADSLRTQGGTTFVVQGR